MSDRSENFDNFARKTTEIYKCPSCGADMVFSAKTQKLHCEHCGIDKEIEKNKDVAYRDYLTAEFESENWSNETKIIKCDNCGAKEIVSRFEIAKSCPFCGATNIIETEELTGVRPNAVIPFLFDEEAARSCFVKWIKKRFFVPEKLKASARANTLGGVYSPCWYFNANSRSSYEGRLGKEYTERVGSGKNAHNEVRMRYSRVSGVVDDVFRDFMVEASPVMDQRQFDKIRPFNLDNAVGYDKRYLAGFSALHYDRTLDEAWTVAEREFKRRIRKGIIAKYEADVVDYLNVDTSFSDVAFRYMLLPIWICNYKFRGKTYNFFVNGSTGKVWGKTPLSPVKVGIAALAVLIIVGIIFLIAYLNR